MRRSLARFIIIAAAVLIAGLAHVPRACAHASLVKAEPADGAVIPASPAALRLTFNEPVSPLAVRLFSPNGTPIALGKTASENATLSIAIPSLQQGTHLLSWRVISADGHPVGGSLTFSIGAPSAQPSSLAVSDSAVRYALWAAKLVLYLGLFVGIGGASFRAWIADPHSRAAEAWMLTTLVAGLVATPLSVGLQGLDALDLPLAELRQRAVWEAGLETSYGFTAIAAACALFAALFSFAAPSIRLARGLALAGLIGIGFALALSGHASNAAPQLVNRPVVLVHAVCVAFWVGSFLPLLAIMCGPRAAEGLAGFSRAIPLPLALLVVSGAWLAVVQLGRFDALWTTSYGEVLFRKLVLVFALLGLGAANRFWLVPSLNAGRKGRGLAISIALELAIAVAVLALVASWRFTPPPRALAAADTVFVHIHGDKAMAEIEFTQRRPRGAGVRVLVLDGAFTPLAAKEVALVLANPAAGIEPIRRKAAHQESNVWRVEDVRIPVDGKWNLRVEILVNDFEKVMLDEIATLPRMP